MEVNIATILTLIGTIIATIGGKEAWSYYKKKLELKAKVAMHGNHSKDELREEIQELKENVRLLTKRILDLETERETDKKRIASKNTEIALLRKDSGL